MGQPAYRGRHEGVGGFPLWALRLPRAVGGPARRQIQDDVQAGGGGHVPAVRAHARRFGAGVRVQRVHLRGELSVVVRLLHPRAYAQRPGGQVSFLYRCERRIVPDVCRRRHAGACPGLGRAGPGISVHHVRLCDEDAGHGRLGGQPRVHRFQAVGRQRQGLLVGAHAHRRDGRVRLGVRDLCGLGDVPHCPRDDQHRHGGVGARGGDVRRRGTHHVREPGDASHRDVCGRGAQVQPPQHAAVENREGLFGLHRQRDDVQVGARPRAVCCGQPVPDERAGEPPRRPDCLPAFQRGGRIPDQGRLSGRRRRLPRADVRPRP
mmetsp:Transcript_41854/g.80003  ORF Transcript_41854/g.80003 Transcript_41854/m.80003 type:complete len:320 (+) Transcript_41854:1131-2090(+)